MGSERSKTWTVEKGENAVKATFFIRFDEGIGGELPKLAYKDIKAAISETGNPIGDTTLTRALESLRSKGELDKQGRYKDTRYSLKERPQADLVAVSASADRMAIEAAAGNIGAITDPKDGWAFYGVPASMRHRLRTRLRSEAWRFQEQVDTILEAETEHYINRLVRRARGRLTQGETKAARRALRYAFDSVEDFHLLSSVSWWSMAFLEHVAPGMISHVMTSLNKRIISDPKAILRELAGASGPVAEGIKKGIERQERHQKAGRKLFDVLPPRERERAAHEFRDLVMLRASWCAVVR